MSLRFIGRRLVIPLLASSMLLAAAAGSALAKCEGPDKPEFCNEVIANVEYDMGSTIRAGSDTPLRIWISRGEQPIAATSVTLVFTRVGEDTTVRVEARSSGDTGMWLADVNLPADGAWGVVAEVDGVDGGAVLRLNLDFIRVFKPLTLPQDPVTPVTPTPVTPINPATPALPIALLVAGIAAAGLAATALRGRSRRKAPAA